ncbi:MAG TPA: DUF1249 domain-containing protein [Steroidobacteraceae bacterium]|nr:DUF1249 domain-containing protein [Steroidobacteraceae bacterium]
MLNDSLTTVSWRARPRSFVALMSLYESNYIRCGWLAGDVTALAGRHRSVVAGDCDLLLTVVERSPYTTTLNLTYLLPQHSAALAYPDMGVRLYHDARLCEAQEWAAAHQHPELRVLRSRMERELDQRWARNVMLNKWLEYCVERGHRFSPATRALD